MVLIQRLDLYSRAHDRWHLYGDAAIADHIELVRVFALSKQDLTLFDHDRARTFAQEFQDIIAEPGEKFVGRQIFGSCLSVHYLPSKITGYDGDE